MGLNVASLARALSIPSKAARAFSRLRRDTWVMQGTEAVSGKPLTIGYSGSEEHRAYLKRIAFGGCAKEIFLGKHTAIWGCRRSIVRRFPDTAIIYLQVPRKHVRWLLPSGSLCQPEWIWGEKDYALVDFSGSSIKRDLRRMRQNGLTYKVSTDPHDVARVLNELVLPYVAARFGDELMSKGNGLSDLYATQDSALCFSVLYQGGTVAGAILGRKGKKVIVWGMGVKLGGADYLKMGAVAALYYFIHEHFANQDFESFSYGLSKPFFGGLMGFKQKWGMRLTAPASQTFHVQVRRVGEGGKSFLLNNPFITEEKGGLAAAVFYEGKPDAAEVAALRKQYQLPGVLRTRVFELSNGHLAEVTNR